MQTSLKTLTNIQTWRLAAITIGGALAMSLATTAFAAAKPGITSSTTATGQVGVSYTASSPWYQITATNSPTSYSTTVSISRISFHSTTGKFTSTPTNAGGTGSATLALHIDPPAPTITSAGTASGTAGSSFFYQITANQAIPSGGWGTTVSIPGVSFSTTTGAFPGTPTAAGTFNGNI